MLEILGVILTLIKNIFLTALVLAGISAVITFVCLFKGEVFESKLKSYSDGNAIERFGQKRVLIGDLDVSVAEIYGVSFAVLWVGLWISIMVGGAIAGMMIEFIDYEPSRIIVAICYVIVLFIAYPMAKKELRERSDSYKAEVIRERQEEREQREKRERERRINQIKATSEYRKMMEHIADLESKGVINSEEARKQERALLDGI